MLGTYRVFGINLTILCSSLISKLLEIFLVCKVHYKARFVA